MALLFCNYLPMMIVSPLVSTPLPAVQTTNLDYPDAHHAYNTCFTLDQNANIEEDHIYARILGYLILNAPSLDAQIEVTKAIHSCSQDERKLLELGKCFLVWFILPFKRFRRYTLASSEYLNNAGFNKLEESLKANTLVPPNDHQTAKIQALHRDGYKCPVTGIYDLTAVDMVPIDYDAMIAEGSYAVNTKLAHILPQSTSFPPTSSLTKKNYDILVSAVLKSFGYDIEKVNGPNVHSLYNVITMQYDMYNAFEKLELWFESTEKENCYLVNAIYPFSQACSKVTFVSPDPLTLPYPSPQFLALHAACARIACLSGAGKYINNLQYNASELDVLATDGTSSMLLTYALWKSVDSNLMVDY